MGRVLVLNASFEPLSLISVQRAVVLLLREKAEAIETDVSRQLRAERISLPMPLVIRRPSPLMCVLLPRITPPLSQYRKRTSWRPAASAWATISSGVIGDASLTLGVGGSTGPAP